MLRIFYSIFEELSVVPYNMDNMVCPNCGTVIEAEGLPISVGGFSLYCVVCGHSWQI